MKTSGFWTQDRISFNGSEGKRRFLNFRMDLRNAGGSISEELVKATIETKWSSITKSKGLYGVLTALGYFPTDGWVMPKTVEYKGLTLPVGWDFRRIVNYRSPSKTTPAMESLPIILTYRGYSDVAMMTYSEYKAVVETHSNLEPTWDNFNYIKTNPHWWEPAMRMAGHFRNLVGNPHRVKWYAGDTLTKLKKKGAKEMGIKSHHRWSPADCLAADKSLSLEAAMNQDNFVDWYTWHTRAGYLFPVSQKLMDSAPKGSATITGAPKANDPPRSLGEILTDLKDLENRGILRIANPEAPANPDPSWLNFHDRVCRLLREPDYLDRLDSALSGAIFNGSPPYYLITPTGTRWIKEESDPRMQSLTANLKNKQIEFTFGKGFGVIRPKGQDDYLYVEIKG